MDQQASEEQGLSQECQRTRQYANEFLNGELEESLSIVIAIHIEACRPCGRRMTFEAAFLRNLARDRNANNTPLPAGVEENVMSLLREWRAADA